MHKPSYIGKTKKEKPILLWWEEIQRRGGGINEKENKETETGDGRLL